MNAQVYTVRPDGTGLRRLTDGGKETNRLGGWTHDGTALLLASNRRTPASMDAYLVGPERRRLAARRRDPRRRRADRRQPRRPLRRDQPPRAARRRQPLPRRPAGRPRASLTPHEGPGSFRLGRVLPRRPDDLPLVERRPRPGRVRPDPLGDDGTPGPIEVVAARDDAELSGLALDETGQTAALVWNVAGRSELALLDLATRQLDPGPGALPAEIGRRA